MPNSLDRFARWGSTAYGRKGGTKGATRTGASTPRQHPEADVQASAVKYLGWALPKEVEWTATLSGAHLGENQRKAAKRTGLRPGISDIVLVAPNRGAFFLEVKPPRGQRDAKGRRQYRSLTEDQERWAAAAGKRWQTCHSLEEIEAALLLWGIQPRCTIDEANRYALRDAQAQPPELDL